MICRLMNGQIWHQVSYAYHYHYAFMPKVVIDRSGSVYRMNVDGVDQLSAYRGLSDGVPANLRLQLAGAAITYHLSARNLPMKLNHAFAKCRRARSLSASVRRPASYAE